MHCVDYVERVDECCVEVHWDGGVLRWVLGVYELEVGG